MSSITWNRQDLTLFDPEQAAIGCCLGGLAFIIGPRVRSADLWSLDLALSGMKVLVPGYPPWGARLSGRGGSGPKSEQYTLSGPLICPCTWLTPVVALRLHNRGLHPKRRKVHADACPGS